MKNILNILLVFILLFVGISSVDAGYTTRAKSSKVAQKYPPKLVMKNIKKKFGIDLTKVYSDYRMSYGGVVVWTDKNPVLRLTKDDFKKYGYSNSGSNSCGNTKKYLPRAKSSRVKKNFPPKLVIEAVKRKYNVDLTEAYSDYRSSRNNSAVVWTSKHHCLRIYKKDLVAPVENKAPVANAGNDKTITEGDSVTLKGTGTDSDGTIVKYEWFDENNNKKHDGANYVISDLPVGIHRLKLKVTDNKGASDIDEAIITVKKVLVSYIITNITNQNLSESGGNPSFDLETTEDINNVDVSLSYTYAGTDYQIDMKLSNLLSSNGTATVPGGSNANLWILASEISTGKYKIEIYNSPDINYDISNRTNLKFSINNGEAEVVFN